MREEAKLWIVRTGTSATLPEVQRRHGDFDDWFRSGLGLPEAQVAVVSPFEGEPLPPLEQVRGAVLTGSSAMVTEQADWMRRTARWALGLLEAGRPLLGVCFGHQLLSWALGGEVGDNPRGRQMGTTLVYPSPQACGDPLFGALPCDAPWIVQETHVQSVLRAPPGSVSVAFDEHDAHQALRLGPSAWSVQFHPEMDAAVMRALLEARREVLLREGLDPDFLIAGCRDSEHGRRLLRRFAELVCQY